ncbi:MAG: RDD family protein [candidate division Zixibacteria bacterium]|nr:RDD family protein [candidate division Zixibacteria bacterium]
MNKLSYAGLGSRFLALLIDGLLLAAIFFPTTRIAKGVWIMAPSDHLWRLGWFITDPLCMIFLLVIFIYFVVLEGVFGRTVGKRLLRLRVVRRDGGNSGLLKAMLRNLLRLVDGLPIFSILGAVLIVVSPEKARVGDLVAGTRVVKTDR